MITLRRIVISVRESQPNFCYCNEIPEAGSLFKGKKELIQDTVLKAERSILIGQSH